MSIYRAQRPASPVTARRKRLAYAFRRRAPPPLLPWPSPLSHVCSPVAAASSGVVPRLPRGPVRPAGPRLPGRSPAPPATGAGRARGGRRRGARDRSPGLDRGLAADRLEPGAVQEGRQKRMAGERLVEPGERRGGLRRGAGQRRIQVFFSLCRPQQCVGHRCPPLADPRASAGAAKRGLALLGVREKSTAGAGGSHQGAAPGASMLGARSQSPGRFLSEAGGWVRNSPMHRRAAGGGRPRWWRGANSTGTRPRRQSTARNPHHPLARLTMSRAVSRLMSGQHEMKISVPWTVPITWRQRAWTPFCIRSR
jgi:hypothetical protein